MKCIVPFLVVVRNTPLASKAFKRTVDTRGYLGLRDHMTNKNRPYNFKNIVKQMTYKLIVRPEY